MLPFALGLGSGAEAVGGADAIGGIEGRCHMPCAIGGIEGRCHMPCVVGSTYARAREYSWAV